MQNLGRNGGTGPIEEILTSLDIDLASGNQASALFKASVSGYNGKFGLTQLEFPGGMFSVTGEDLPIGHAARLKIAARDVSLTLEHQSDTSILNISLAIVDQILPERNSQAMVRLISGGIPMLPRITQKSVAPLDLKAGKQVFAQVKSIDLLN